MCSCVCVDCSKVWQKLDNLCESAEGFDEHCAMFVQYLWGRGELFNAILSSSVEADPFQIGVVILGIIADLHNVCSVPVFRVD